MGNQQNTLGDAENTRPHRTERGSVQLICLPPAGAGASRYREWPAHLPDHVKVVPLALPGRESRFHEAAIDSMDRLVDQLLREVSSHVERPFAFFGHSMGALLAFELIRRLRPLGFEPVRFFAAGCGAPHLARIGPDRHTLPDHEFMTSVQELNGIPAEVLQHPDYVELVLPTLRSDFTLVETYVFRPRRALRCPVSAFGGLRDPEVGRGDLDAWSHHTTGRFTVHVLPGDHFFVDSSRKDLLGLVARELDGLGRGGEPVSRTRKGGS